MKARRVYLAPPNPDPKNRLPRIAMWSISILLLGASLAACDDLDISAEDIEFGDPVHSVYEANIQPSSAPASLSSDENQPLIESPFTNYNLGKVLLGKVIEHTLAIHNGGSAQLVIYQLYTTCDYLSAELSAGEIPPGKYALLTVTVDARNDPEPPGTTIKRAIIIVSNDPAQPEKTIWIQATVESP